jgi:hypothetical protein
VKSHVLNQASEAAEMILRVDNILKVRRRLHIFCGSNVADSVCGSVADP